MVPDAKHLMAKGGAALRIFQSLEAGMQTSFTCQNPNTPLTSVRVVVSPVRYLIALPEFQKCTAALAEEKKSPPRSEKKR